MVQSLLTYAVYAYIIPPTGSPEELDPPHEAQGSPALSA